MIILQSSFCEVLESLSVTPETLKRFPSIRKPTRGAASGIISVTISVTRMGKITFSVFETGRRFSILIILSFFVVRSFINGG